MRLHWADLPPTSQPAAVWVRISLPNFSLQPPLSPCVSYPSRPLIKCSVLVEDGVARGIVTADGQERRATAVLANADPFRLRQLAGAHNFSADFNARLDSMRRDGTTMKVWPPLLLLLHYWGGIMQRLAGRAAHGWPRPPAHMYACLACLTGWLAWPAGQPCSQGASHLPLPARGPRPAPHHRPPAARGRGQRAAQRAAGLCGCAAGQAARIPHNRVVLPDHSGPRAHRWVGGWVGGLYWCLGGVGQQAGACLPACLPACRPPARLPACSLPPTPPADAEGRYSSALFVQWVPFELAGSSWEEEEERYVRHLLTLLDRFAPGG